MDILERIRTDIESGVLSNTQMDDLYKSLSAGYGYAGKPTDLTHGGVLQQESLEATLKSVTFTEENIKLYKDLNKDKANNLIEMYNRILAYGSDASPYMAEGGAPQEEDSVYVRDFVRLTFFGIRRKLSHQATLVTMTNGDVVANQAAEGTLDLLKKVERELYWGSCHFMNQTTGAMDGNPGNLPSNSVELVGLLQRLTQGDTDTMVRSGDFEGYGASRSIISDLRGINITQDDIEGLSVIAAENFGQPKRIDIEPAALSAFIKQFYTHFRMLPGGEKHEVGYDVNRIVTSCGRLEFSPNHFLRPKTWARPNAINQKAPIVGAATAALADTGAGNSGFLAGTYQAKVTFANDFAESNPIQATPVVGHVANNNISVTLANVPTCNYINVYLSAPGGSAGTEQYVGRFKNNGNGAYILSNAKMPGLGEAFLLDLRPNTMRIKELLPFSKLTFATIATSMEFAIVTYLGLAVFCPRFCGVFKNVGKN